MIDRVVGVFVRRSGGGERRWFLCRAIGNAGAVRGGLGIVLEIGMLIDVLVISMLG